MKKEKWSQKPMTWGGYAKLCGVCYIISLLFSLVYYIAFWRPTWFCRFMEFIKKPFCKIHHRG